MIEVCHGIERVPQPVPYKNEGGDCFACAATAGLRFLYPEREISLDEVWDLFVEEYYDGSAQANLQKLRGAVDDFLHTKVTEFPPAHEALKTTFAEVSAEKPRTTVGNTWFGFEKVLNKASYEWGGLEVTYDIVQPTFARSAQCSYPWRFQDLSLDYTRRLEGWLRGGWVAFAEIKLDGGGPFIRHDDGSVWLSSIDHFVVIDGIRHEYIAKHDPDTGAFKSGGWEDSIHVVDSSSRDITGWHRTMPFTRSHAASSWWLARRDVR
jgi:hypothetical protein